MNAAEIRAKYPSPRDPLNDDHTAASYCVGGALCMYQTQLQAWSMPIPLRFPNPFDLTECIIQTNMDINIDRAIAFAEAIIKANDAGDYEEAWTELDEALSYRAEA